MSHLKEPPVGGTVLEAIVPVVSSPQAGPLLAVIIAGLGVLALSAGGGAVLLLRRRPI